VTGLAPSVQLAWALSVVLQLTLVALLFAKANFRKLPLLTTYTALNLAQAAFLVFLYVSRNPNLRGLAWSAEAVTLLFQALAALEAIRLLLRPYPGIWGLGWRAIALISAILLAYIAKQTAGHYDWALLEANRGYHLLFATAVICCFLLVRYYSIVIPSAYKLLLGGFCFFSCVSILIDTILQSILYPRYAAYETIWQLADILPFAFVVVLWMVALRQPLPVDDRLRALPSDDLYQHVSPLIDDRLRQLNEKLLRLWKPEARS
jgi:hypothetical protein